MRFAEHFEHDSIDCPIIDCNVFNSFNNDDDSKQPERNALKENEMKQKENLNHCSTGIKSLLTVL